MISFSKDLKRQRKLAIGEVKTVPAGKYAKQYLDNQHLYSDVKDKIVYAKDVKQVLNYVEKVILKWDLYMRPIYIRIMKEQIK